jgi:hypothetical protein
MEPDGTCKPIHIKADGDKIADLMRNFLRRTVKHPVDHGGFITDQAGVWRQVMATML